MEGGTVLCRTGTPPVTNQRAAAGPETEQEDASEVKNDGNVKETSVALGHGILNPVFRSARGESLIPLISVTLVRTVSGRPIADAVTCFRFYMPEDGGEKGKRENEVRHYDSDRQKQRTRRKRRGGSSVVLSCWRLTPYVCVYHFPPPPARLQYTFSSIYSMLNSCQAWVGTVGQSVRAWLYARPPAGSLQERGASAPS